GEIESVGFFLARGQRFVEEALEEDRGVTALGEFEGKRHLSAAAFKFVVCRPKLESSRRDDRVTKPLPEEGLRELLEPELALFDLLLEKQAGGDFPDLALELLGGGDERDREFGQPILGGGVERAV